MLAVGNVGEELAPYTDSDIFLTRDGGFTWEEIHKDAHMWEFGDSGSVILPPSLNLTSERLERHGLFLIEDSQNIFLWVGHEAVPRLVQDAKHN